MSTSISRVFDFAYHQLQNHPSEKCFNYKQDSIWESISTEKYLSDAQKVSSSLLHLGIKPTDKIAVIASNNHPNWHILDIGILQIGAQNVPLYATLSEKDYAYILNHSDALFCFVTDKNLYEKVNLSIYSTNLFCVVSFSS